jgi:hypothetical protein
MLAGLKMLLTACPGSPVGPLGPSAPAAPYKATGEYMFNCIPSMSYHDGR